MDIFIHWGVFKHLRDEVHAKAWVLVSAIILDIVVLFSFLWVKAKSDIFIVWVSVAGLLIVFAAEKWFLKLHVYEEHDKNYN